MNLTKTKPVTSDEMRALEESGVKRGISKLCMMENAGASIAEFVFETIRSETSNPEKFRIVLVAGTGNNGGDVFVAARHLAFWKRYFHILLVLVGEEDKIKADEAVINWKIVKQLEDISLLIVNSGEKIVELSRELSIAKTIIAGIFGTGFRGKPGELQSKVIERINKCDVADIISVDVPSGLDADTGSYEIAVVSDYTITMHAPKVGMLTDSGRQICGNILIANIGIPS